MKPLMAKGARFLAYLLVVLFLTEAILRLCFPIPELKNFDKSYYLGPKRESVQHLRDKTWTWGSAVDTTHIFEMKMNLYGFRDEEWNVEKPKNKTRVLFIGDSFVEGVMAEQDETLPEAFKYRAGENEFEILNAGMTGRSLTAYARLTADMVPTFKPDVLFICIFSNDLGQKEPVLPSASFQPEKFTRFTPRLIELWDESKRHGPIRFRWKKEATSLLPSIDSPSNPWRKNEAKLAPHVNPQLAEMMKDSRFNPFKTNTLYKEERYLKLKPALGDFLPFIYSICQKHNVEPIIVYIPSRSQVTKHYYQFEHEFCQILCSQTLDLTTGAYQAHQQEIKRQCDELKMTFIDLTKDVQNEEQSGKHLYWNYDEHMKAAGYQFLGNQIWYHWQRSEDSNQSLEQ